MPASEPRNPFNALLLLASFLFILTLLVVFLVPKLEQMATEAGQPPAPPTGLRLALHQEGWLWLIYEVAAIVVFGLLSMVLDRLRSLKKERSGATIPPANDKPTPSNS
jgi:type II secretory pathway component PulF